MSYDELKYAVKQIETEFGSIDRVNRNRYISVAIGAVAGAVSQIPAAPVASVGTYWFMNVEGSVKALLSKINEEYVIDITTALSIARQLYIARYRRVHDINLIVAELNWMLPAHAAKNPDLVTEVFAPLSEEQRHWFATTIAPTIKNMLG